MSEIGIQFIWLSFKVKRRTILSRRKYQGFRFDVHCLYVTIFEIHRNHSKYIRDKQTQILVYIRISIIAAMFLRHSRRKRRKYVSTSKARAVEMCYQLAEIYVSLMSSWYYRVITTQNSFLKSFFVFLYYCFATTNKEMRNNQGD